MLYNKYRPQLFKDLIGQEFSKELLVNVLSTENELHSFIFYGPNGTGKTTVARLFAQALNCSQFKDLREICKSCSSCKLIQEGKCIDIVEIDGATHNGVEYIREITRNSIYPPLQLKKKLYIIDEAHCLSSQSWNALLKLIEEPPSHLVLIFLTTAIHKIIPTILSRCQKLHFPAIEQKDLLELLKKVSEKEGKKLSSNLLTKLTKNANGSAREAIVLLEQAFLNSAPSNNLLKNLNILEEESTRLLKLLLQSKCAEATELMQKNLTNIEKIWGLLLDRLLELSFFELSSNSTELLSIFSESEAKKLLEDKPNIDSVINFLAPVLSSDDFSTSPAYSKFILLNLFRSLNESPKVLGSELNKESIEEIKEKLPKAKKEVTNKNSEKEAINLTTQLNKDTDAPPPPITNPSSSPITIEKLPKTEELFSHNLLISEVFDLPNFKFESLLSQEKEIISLLRAVDKNISKENYSLLKKYLSSDEEQDLSIVKLFAKMHPKYELICSNDCCIAVFETEEESKYFNLKTKNLELREKLYNIFEADIKWKGITLSELQQAIKKNKKYREEKTNSDLNSAKSQKLFEEVKEKYFPEKLVKKS